MRSAAARAASRRGSSRMRRLPRPRLVEQRERHARRLACAGRRDEHGARTLGNAERSAAGASSIGRGAPKGTHRASLERAHVELGRSLRQFEARVQVGASRQTAFPFGRISETSGSTPCPGPCPQEVGMLTVHHLGVSQSERIVWLCEELDLDYELKRYERRRTIASRSRGLQGPASDGRRACGHRRRPGSRRERRDLRLPQCQIWRRPARARACRSGLSPSTSSGFTGRMGHIGAAGLRRRSLWRLPARARRTSRWSRIALSAAGP